MLVPFVDIAELAGDALIVGDHHRFLFAASYTLDSKVACATSAQSAPHRIPWI